MKRAGLLVTIAVAGLMVLAPGAGAAPVAIVGYDVLHTPSPGFGGWSHTYTGTTTPTGRLLPTTAGCPPCAIVDEQGGRGTLNDGVVATTIDADQLLYTGDDSANAAVQPAITLHLATPARISQIRVWGGNVDFNIIPGALTGASVTIGGVTVPLTSTPAGNLGVFGIPFDDILDLTGTPIAATPTDTITLSGFTTDPSTFNQFSAAEITIDGAAEPVTAATLCDRTRAAVTGGAAYQALPNKRRSQVDKLVAKACDAARDITAKGTTPAKKTRLVADFKRAIEDLRAGGWLTGGDAADIDALADRI